MKAILEFNLPEDKSEFEDASNGTKWKLLVWDLDQYLRSQIKYNSDNLTDEAYNKLEKVREQLHDLIRENGLTLD
jgi:hypothetical protein